jgi:hypothetical protein
LIKKSRMIVAGGLAVAVATAGVAVAGGTGAQENTAGVVAKVTPSKLSKKKFTPVNVFLGVVNSRAHIDGAQSNPASERISWSRNIKVNLSKAPRCTATIPNGTTPAQAKALCPPKSFLGSGDATVHGPPAGQTLVADPVVSVFNGPGRNQLRLHTYDPALAAASPIVNGRIINGRQLFVPDAPDTGGVMVTSFNAKILKSKKVATAKCKPKTFKTTRRVVYDDGSSESVSKTQRCKVKR